MAQHPNLLRLYDVLATDDHFYVVCELMGGDLWYPFVVNGAGEERTVRGIMRQILDGLKHLHSVMKILHRDITSPNVLINDKHAKVVKIADFGSTIR